MSCLETLIIENDLHFFSCCYNTTKSLLFFYRIKIIGGLHCNFGKTVLWVSSIVYDTLST